MEIRKWNYMQSGTNYGVNSIAVSIGMVTLWFSYDTVVAFMDYTPATKSDVVEMPTYVISENNWGTTTGKHINAIDSGNKKKRLPRAEFQKQLEKCMKKHGL